MGDNVASGHRGRAVGRIIGALSVLVSAAILLALAAPAQAGFPGKNGKIAYAAYESVGHGAGSPDIAAVNPDGTGALGLTSGDWSFEPAWSPDGSKIAFTRSRFDLNAPAYCSAYCGAVDVMNADGSGLSMVSNGKDGDWHPAWSPDGQRIAFSSGRSGGFDIYTMNADGSDVVQVTTGPAADLRPAWSPRGDQIAFVRADSAYPGPGTIGAGTLFTINADGTGERALAVRAQNPNWSPDGEQLAYDDGDEVWLANLDGTGGGRITTEPPPVPDPDTGFFGPSWNIEPAWSPDGTKIVFEHGECGWGACFPGSLETVNPDGTGRAPLINRGSEPDWQPVPNQPPDCRGLTATPSSLPRPGFRTVTLAGATDPDGDAVTITIDGVTQDEPVGRLPDARAGQSTDQVELRARRWNRGDGRVYRIAFTASDGTDSCSGVATVEVWRKKKQPAVDSAPPSYNSFGN